MVNKQCIYIAYRLHIASFLKVGGGVRASTENFNLMFISKVFSLKFLYAPPQKVGGGATTFIIQFSICKVN